MKLTLKQISEELNVPTTRPNTTFIVDGVIDCEHLDSSWYDRNLHISIEDERFIVDIIVSGDIEMTLLDENNNELASVKGTEDCNNFYEVISPYIKNDKELDELYNGRLVPQYNNWFDIVATSKRTGLEYQYEDASYSIDQALRTALDWMDTLVDPDPEEFEADETPVQKYASANTSINSVKKPALFNKLNYKFIKENSLPIVDYGCGKFTSIIQDTLPWGTDYYGYDPYNQPEDINRTATNFMNTHNEYLFVSCNVLNVIAEDDIVADICRKAERAKYFAIAVYEGDRSGEGRPTKKGCYQRNQKVAEYLRFFDDAILYKGFITNCKDLFLK